MSRFSNISKKFDIIIQTRLSVFLSTNNALIRGKSIKWLRSFLEDKKSHTTINKARSSDKPLSIGFPQGSILGPIFFILFINDFQKAVKFSTVHHFPYETNLLLTE